MDEVLINDLFAPEELIRIKQSAKAHGAEDVTTYIRRVMARKAKPPPGRPGRPPGKKQTENPAVDNNRIMPTLPCCWTDKLSHMRKVFGEGSAEENAAKQTPGTCMLRAGHEGPHEFSPDYELFCNSNPEPPQ